MTTQGAVTSYGVMGDGVTLTFEKSADWDAGDGQRGFAANITVINETGSAMEMLSLPFDFPANVTQMWNASFARNEDSYDVTPTVENTRIEPSEVGSFGFQGTYSGELGEIAVSICPDDSRYYFDYIVWWQSEVYASLSEEGKARVASGDLVWNGYGYSLRPTILMPNRPGQDPSLPPDQDP